MADKKISELNAATTIGDSDDFAVVQAAETKQVNASVIKTYASTAPTIVGGTINSASIGATTPSTGNFTTLGTTGNVTLGDASGDTVTFNAGTVTLNNSTTISAASTKTLTLNGGAGSNGLVLDASNNVGIGTSSPASKFGVFGNVIFGNQTTTATTTSTLRFTSTASANFIQSGSTTSSGSAQPLIFGSLAGVAIWLTLDASGNLGLSVTPSAWASSWRALQIGAGASLSSSGAYTFLGQNFYNDGALKYISTGAASYYQQVSGAHSWFTAPSGTAGTTITPTTAMTLDISGNLGAAGYGFFDGWVKITQGLTKNNSNYAVGFTNNLVNNTGSGNCVLGVGLGVNTTGCDSVAIGASALSSQTTGGSGGSSNANVAIGAYSLNSATTYAATLGAITGGSGYINGTYAGVQLTYLSGSTVATGGLYPTADITVSGGVVTVVTLVYAGSRFKDTTTVMTCLNTSLGGSGSGFSIPVATLSYALGNVAVGYGALWVNEKGSGNTVIGNRAATAMTTGSGNTIIGNNAYFSGTSGSSNIAIGTNALRNCTGNNNSGYGNNSGLNITTGSNNVILGSYTGSGAPISATGSGYVVLSDYLGTVRGMFDASGNFGIGTTSPTRKLQVSAAADCITQCESTIASGNALFQLQSSDGNVFVSRLNGPSAGSNPSVALIYTSSTIPIAFLINSVELMRLTANGTLTLNYGSLTLIGSGGLGYGTGSGGAITQITSRTTGVTLNKTNGAITLVSAAGLATYQTFTVTNSTVAATDVIHVCQKSGTDKYIILVTAVAAGSFAITYATTGGTTTEQPVFNFAIIKAVTA
jgi:hypothetical protein